MQTVTLPALTEEGAIYARIDAGISDAASSQLSAGIPVFKPMGKNTANSRTGGYLPDPAIHNFCIRAKLRGCERLLSGYVTVPLYDDTARYPHAMPLVVEVRRVAKRRSSQPIAISDFATREVTSRMIANGTLVAGGKGSGTGVQHVTLALMEGEDFDLEVTCMPSATVLEASFAVTATAAKQAGITTKAMAAQLLAGMTEHWPIEAIAAATHLRVCHAIARPSVMPTWGNGVRAGRPPPIGGVPANGFTLSGEVLLDLDHVDGFRIVAETPAAEGGVLDDRSRSRSLLMRRAGRWPHLPGKDGTPVPLTPRDVVGFDVDADGQVSFPTDTVTLLEVSNLPVHGAVDLLPGSLFPRADGRYTVVDLSRLHAAAAASMPIQLPIPVPAGAEPAPIGPDGLTGFVTIKTSVPHPRLGTGSRTMELRLIAQSRTAGAFETAPAYIGGKEHLLRRRSPLRAEEQSVQSDPICVTLAATERPIAPLPRRPEPAFITTRQAIDGGDGTIVYTVEQLAKTRLWFARGLPVSAQIRIGLVLWPDRYRTQLASDLDENTIVLDGRKVGIGDFADADLAPIGAYVTRWGGDPVRVDPSPQRGFLIPPEAFADLSPPDRDPAPHEPQMVDGRTLPTSGGLAEQHRRISLLTYEPRFDLDRQEWFVDVDLRPVRASEPFVRFGVVAYDTDAPSELQLSSPVTVTATLLPHRCLRVTTGRGHVGVELIGLGSLDIADLRDGLSAEQAAAFQMLRKPAVQLYLMHERTIDGRLIRTPVLEKTKEEDDGAIWLTVRDVKGTLHWSTNLALPDVRGLGDGQLVVYVEEVDRRMPATYESEPIDVATMFDPKRFVLSGPRFSARVPFHIVKMGTAAQR